MNLHKRKRAHQNNERWLVSYADFITLLFAFFVVLYASSQADKHKMVRLSEAIESAFSKLGAMPQQGSPHSTTGQISLQTAEMGTELSGAGRFSAAGPASAQDVSELRVALERALATQIRNQTVALREGPEGLVISLREIGFFNSGSAELRADAQPAISRIVAMLRDRPCRIRVEGHTDNIPIHTKEFDSNWELSTARATSMIRQLVAVFGIAPERLSAAGYAEFHPIVSNESPGGRSLNRRIDLVILSGQSSASDPDNSQSISANGTTGGSLGR